MARMARMARMAIESACVTRETNVHMGAWGRTGQIRHAS
jgi:hypothetical protein